MRIAICQPTYLPWLGYFDLMDQVDTFVLLDTVQFEKRSWQQRNRIKTASGLQWLTVPVTVHGRFEQAISEAIISDPRFAQKHLRTIEVNYGRAPFFSNLFPAFSEILRNTEPNSLLAKLNGNLLEWFREILGIRTALVLASSLTPEGKRTHLLADICRKLGATEYVSPLGSADYLLSELNVLSACGVEVFFHNYAHPQYKQLFPPFLPFASTIDLILNEGERALGVVRSGRNPPLKPEHVSTGILEAKQS